MSKAVAAPTFLDQLSMETGCEGDQRYLNLMTKMEAGMEQVTCRYVILEFLELLTCCSLNYLSQKQNI